MPLGQVECRAEFPHNVLWDSRASRGMALAYKRRGRREVAYGRRSERNPESPWLTIAGPIRVCHERTQLGDVGIVDEEFPPAQVGPQLRPY